MTEAVLTLNAGSSSLKFALFPARGDRPLATGLADRIGPEGTLKLKGRDGQPVAAAPGDLRSHAGAIRAVFDSFRGQYPDLTLRSVGHRVVHGGVSHAAPVTVTATVMAELEALAPFAPLHQPHNLTGIRAAAEAFAGVAQVACFDTAFHRNQPWINDAFALPRALYDEGVRRYGFHGLSYDYIASVLPGEVAHGRVIVAHLGNGASMCALHNGRSVASTMGFSALDGLPMGTRCGQIDPGVLLYLMDQKGMSAAQISDLLYRQSGLLGLSGLSNDMRMLETAETPEAEQAIDYFVYRCQREIGSLAAAVGGIDALVFTAGIGENSRLIRARICARLSWMGIELDPARNADNGPVISAAGAPTTVMVIPTNEELVIARAARAAVGLTEQEAA
ncbi:acetate/propionate family kinase [Fertoebacter nigrum]|uniref:Acetate kinase n=1 Tax=Fertoeibacter niger TaxID=2656921 RepID=A0A8X8H5S8_9RHOB|nr:acetate/propionate family kinase [Fertoeibacter niger]NUB46193.1 acetate/propionate family kinase [Fertoeibacter niger]